MSGQDRREPTSGSGFDVHASHLAHTVGNGLNNLLMQCEVIDRRLRKAGVDDERVAQSVSVMRAEVHRLVGVLDGFRELGDQPELQLAPVAPAPILARAVAELAPRSQSAGVTVDLELDEGLPVVMADERRLGLAVRRALDEAIRIMHGAGRLVVGAGGDEELWVTIAALEGQLRFGPRDDGRERLWLAALRDLVEAQGGRLNVDGGTLAIRFSADVTSR